MFETEEEKKINQEERERCEKLFKLFVKYFEEIEVPHLKNMANIWDKFRSDYERLHDGRKNKRKRQSSKK